MLLFHRTRALTKSEAANCSENVSFHKEIKFDVETHGIDFFESRQSVEVVVLYRPRIVPTDLNGERAIICRRKLSKKS